MRKLDDMVIDRVETIINEQVETKEEHKTLSEKVQFSYEMICQTLNPEQRKHLVNLVDYLTEKMTITAEATYKQGLVDGIQFAN